MRAPSSSQEAKEIATEQERCPRARAVNDRIQQLLDALPYPEPDVCTSKRRQQLEGFALAIGYTIAWGQEITEAEFKEWMETLGGEAVPA